MFAAPVEVHPLLGSSIRNVIAALTEAFDRMTNIVLVFAFCRHMLPGRAGHEIHGTISSRGGRIVSYHPALVIMTAQGKSITVYFIGGMGTFFAPAPDSSSSEEDEAVAVLDSPSPVQPPRRRPRTNNVETRGNPPLTARGSTNNGNGSNNVKNHNSSRTTNNNGNRRDDSDSSLEDTIGLTQELF
jgi:hypothetical protein